MTGKATIDTITEQVLPGNVDDLDFVPSRPHIGSHPMPRAKILEPAAVSCAAI